MEGFNVEDTKVIKKVVAISQAREISLKLRRWKTGQGETQRMVGQKMATELMKKKYSEEEMFGKRGYELIHSLKFWTC